jgi:hypothetical protein
LLSDVDGLGWRLLAIGDGPDRRALMAIAQDLVET